MTTSPTPWPWNYGMAGCITSNGMPIISKANGHLVANLASHNEANAKLIAAAPELLEALQNMLDLRDAIMRGECLPDRPEIDIVSNARAAIAKATSWKKN